MDVVTPNRTDLEWLAKLPATKAEGEAQGFDGRAWLAGYLEASARDQAEAIYLGLNDFMAAGGCTVEDLSRHVEAHGAVLLEAWAATMVASGTDHEEWAREAATQAATTYRVRMEELMATASPEGRA